MTSLRDAGAWGAGRAENRQDPCRGYVCFPRGSQEGHRGRKVCAGQPRGWALHTAQSSHTHRLDRIGHTPFCVISTIQDSQGCAQKRCI